MPCRGRSTNASTPHGDCLGLSLKKRSSPLSSTGNEGDRVAKGQPVAESVKNILGKLVIDSTESTGVIDVYREAGIDIPNLQDLDADLIKKETDESKIALLIDGCGDHCNKKRAKQPATTRYGPNNSPNVSVS